MSEALLGVIIGGLLLPVSQGIGYIVTRYFKQQDETQALRWKSLIELQDAILALVDAEQKLTVRDNSTRNQGDKEIAVARRRVRVLAARIGDEQLWNLIHAPLPNRMNEVANHGATGDPGDAYDGWNARIRELFHEGEKLKRRFGEAKPASPPPVAAPQPHQRLAPANMSDSTDTSVAR